MGERFGNFYSQATIYSDGIAELVPESAPQRNVLGNETEASLFYVRNHEAIEQILEERGEKAATILVRRMNDPSINATLRLIYASILASWNNHEGEAYLLEATEPSDSPNLNAVFCLGLVSSLGTRGDRQPIDIRWAEPRILELLSDDSPASEDLIADRFFVGKIESMSELYAIVSSLVEMLARHGSQQSKDELFAIIKSKKHDWRKFDSRFVEYGNLSVKHLLELQEIANDESMQRQILEQFLKQKDLNGFEKFKNLLGQPFVYSILRDANSPELLAQMGQLELNKAAQVHFEMLKILGLPDPIPEMIDLLDDPQWGDKNLLLYELSRLADPRAVEPIAKALLEQEEWFLEDVEQQHRDRAIQWGLLAIARTGTNQAIRRLIELLDNDFQRLGVEQSNAKWKLDVMEHLIELTGESFGTDTAGWKEWLSLHPDHSVRRSASYPNE